jgi:hypothetical protein
MTSTAASYWDVVAQRLSDSKNNACQKLRLLEPLTRFAIAGYQHDAGLCVTSAIHQPTLGSFLPSRSCTGTD